MTADGDLFDGTDDGTAPTEQATAASTDAPDQFAPDRSEVVAQMVQNFTENVSRGQALAFAVGFTPLVVGLLSGHEAVLGAVIPLTLAALGGTTNRRVRKPLRFAVRHPGFLLGGQAVGGLVGGLGLYLTNATAFWSEVLASAGL